MKKILILNRRDLKNPLSGGAEIYTHEIFRRLSAKFEITHFSSLFGGCNMKETIDNIVYLRKGNELTVHLWGFIHALKNRGYYDIIIDQFNGIGFMTFVLRKSILLIHQLYENFWTAELGVTGYPFKLLEKVLLRFYKNKPALTVSNSTADDLRKLGFGDVTIIHNGSERKPLNQMPEKEGNFTLIYLGRLRKTKNPEDAIKAFLLVRDAVPEAKLWIGGSGPLYAWLKRKYAGIGNLHFLGFVGDNERYEYLKRAHLLLVPSIREGWGQVVIQANAAGTPAIGYDVEGLRDSIQNGKTGILVRDFNDMHLKAIRLWEDKEKYRLMCRHALDWASNFSWEKAGDEFGEYLIKRVS